VHSRIRCRGSLRVRIDGALPAGATVVAVGTYLSYGVLRVTHRRVLRRARPWRFRLRAAIAGRIARLYGARAALVEALVLGRRDDLPKALRQTFADAGLAHLLAISGLHVGVLSSWILLLLRLVGVGSARWLVGAGLTWGYVLLLGAPAPATRAAAFLSLYALARLRQRHPPLEAILAAAVLVILFLEPSAATAVGLWLSGSAVLGTAWAGHLLRRRGRGAHAVVRLAVSSTGAVLFTAPVTALTFGAVAPVGILSNLVAIPLSSVAVPGIFLSLVAGGPLAGGTGVALALLERLAEVAARLPGGHLAGTPGAAFAAPWVVTLAAVVYLSAAAPDRAPLRVRRVLAIAAVVVWGGAALRAHAFRDRAGTLDIHVLDVGQGDAILLRTPADRWLLVDGGPRTRQGDAGRRVVLPYLRRRGVRELAAVIVTHADADHLGGLPSVLREVDVGLVLEPAQPLGTALYLEYQATIDARGTTWRPARAGDTLAVDGITLAVLHPSSRWAAGQFEPNENSVVLHLRFGCFDAILAGDAGQPVERELLRSAPKVEVLKVGHHGSAGGTSADWLRVLGPRTAVISVGRNAFGHPSPDVLDRLRRSGADVWRTDRGGTVTIRTDGSYYSITQRGPVTLAGSVLCRILRLSRSSGSSSSRNGCTPRPPVISQTCSTTSPSPPR
ncbi:MAG: DNA internalization-related competence protein ComEC/Rec2, partial [Gemmatimonadales bacterium]|nr:DNA internalization-related competence protein ComEC/Rec2 [Gemmatimonadales bacterium]